MQAKFYYLNKRKNSTKKPAENSELATYDIKLKTDCSSLNPTIEVRLPAGYNPYGWNYAYLSEFAKYYFIRDYRWNVNGYWEIDLKLDSLASHVVAIRSSRYFIKFAETAYNKWILDNRIQQIAQTQVFTTNPATTLFDFDLYRKLPVKPERDEDLESRFLSNPKNFFNTKKTSMALYADFSIDGANRL